MDDQEHLGCEIRVLAYQERERSVDDDRIEAPADVERVADEPGICLEHSTARPRAAGAALGGADARERGGRQ